MKKRIFEELMKIGVPCNLSGFDYIIEAVEMVLTDESFLRFVTTKLYPTIAENHSKKPAQVERCIRNAVEKSFDCGLADEYFGAQTNPESGKLCNSQFIATIAKRIKYEV